MTENIVWLDFNDAIDPREAQLNDTEALRAGLLDRLESVLLYLFPQGRIRGGKFYVGDVDGNAGKSLVVELEGDRRGLWKDFASDEGGDDTDDEDRKDADEDHDDDDDQRARDEAGADWLSDQGFDRKD